MVVVLVCNCVFAYQALANAHRDSSSSCQRRLLCVCVRVSVCFKYDLVPCFCVISCFLHAAWMDAFSFCLSFLLPSSTNGTDHHPVLDANSSHGSTNPTMPGSRETTWIIGLKIGYILTG